MSDSSSKNIHFFNLRSTSPLPPMFEDLKIQARKNIAWSWKQSLLNDLEKLDPVAWNAADHNLIHYLEKLSQESIQKIEKEAHFKKVFEELHRELKEFNHDTRQSKIAYFCMEYGMTSCLRIYSGGLGVLAGDHLKTASDLKWPLCAVGLAYKHGYFSQQITNEGKQIAGNTNNDFSELPMELVKDSAQNTLKIDIPFPGRNVKAQAWKVGVGHVQLYLLDTDCPENSPEDRQITNNLYGGDAHHRLKQEIVLGVGGYWLLHALKMPCQVYHMNEGHAAFLIWARLLDLMQNQKLSLPEALEYCRQTQVFTTHTPVPAGHDVFGDDLIRPYLELYSQQMKISYNELSHLGKLTPMHKEKSYSMTDLALSGAASVNGVSQIHGRVSREMFQSLYPNLNVEEVPVKGITNGVHLGTWLSDEWQEFFTSHWGDSWRTQDFTPKVSAEFEKMSDESLWKRRLKMKNRLLEAVKEHIRVHYTRRGESPSLIASSMANLNERALVIGFARRFAPYKRATLLFHHIERLEALVRAGYPIVILYAGKAHPNDKEGQALIQEIIHHSRKPSLQGRIIFLENYEMDIARLLVQGCDIWLNTPTRPLEASGTSGMKASINGTLNLSVDDGWWSEAWNGKNGWLIADKKLDERIEFQLEYDSHQIYSLLESEIVPLYFDRPDGRIPHEWISRVKNSIISTLWNFSTARMLKDYNDEFIQNCLERANRLSSHSFQNLKEEVKTLEALKTQWSKIHFDNVSLAGSEKIFKMGEKIPAHINLSHHGISPSALMVEAVLFDANKRLLHKEKLAMNSKESRDGQSRFEGDIEVKANGAFHLAFRVSSQLDQTLLKWY